MISLEAFRRLSSPLSWLSLVDVEFPPAANAIMSAVCAAPASPETLEAWSSICPDQPYPATHPTQVVFEIGRGGLKSSMSFVLVLDRLLRFPNEERVAVGSEFVALMIAPTKRQAASIIRNNVPTATALAELLGGGIEERSLAEGAEIVFKIPGIDAVPVLRCAAPDEATLRGPAPCAVSWSEAGWLPSGPRSINALADLRVAVVPRGVGQFPTFLEIAESTNGPPAGYFYDVCTDTPDNVLKIGPLSSGRVNPQIDEEKLRRELSPEEFSQEILCTTWGLKHSAFIAATPAMATVDEDGAWTTGALSQRGATAFDHGGGDEIGTAHAHAVDVQVSPGHFVRHLVIDFADYWRPIKAPPTRLQIELPLRVSQARGGDPILCDGRAFVDVADGLASTGYKAPDAKDDDVRRKLLARGGKLVVQMPMDPRHQTERFTKLRDLVVAGRVHVVNTEAGRELARQLTTLRATQLASRYLRIEAESGAEDGLADCASYLAEAFDSMTAIRADGTHVERIVLSTNFDRETGMIDRRVAHRVIGPDGEDQGPGFPQFGDVDYYPFFASQVSRGVVRDGSMELLMKSRGFDSYEPSDLYAIVRQLVDEGLVPRDHGPTIAVLQNEVEPWAATVAFMKSRARSR